MLSIRRPRCVPKSAAGPTPTICVATDDNHDFIPIGKRAANHGALPACRQVARGWGGDESPGQEGRKMGAAPPQVGVIMGSQSDWPTMAHAVHILEQFDIARSEEHTSELQSLMRISYAVFCLKKKILIHYNKLLLSIMKTHV